MSEQNKDLVRRLVETFNGHALDPLDSLLADDFVWHGGSFGEIEGLDAFKQLIGAFYAAFPDLRLELDELVAERDLVVSRYTTTGRQSAELLGVPATGKHAQWREQPIYRVADGKIAEIWWVADIFGLMQQLGAIPTAQEAAG
jgi:steroid delta-isomerase-like uncharacterized protein